MLTLINQLYLEFLAFGKENPVVAGLVGLWGLTVFTLIFRDIPLKIYNFVFRQVTTTLTINNCDDIYLEFLDWVSRNKMHSFVRTLHFNNKGRWGYGIPMITIGYGTTFFFFNRRLFKMSRTTVEANQTERMKEQIAITVFGRSHKHFRTLFELIKEFSEEKDDKIQVFQFTDDDWRLLSKQYKRPLDTVIIEPNTKKEITEYIDAFLSQKEWYIENGVPYRTGILLNGPPGTGKTSLIKAICSHYDKHLYLIDLSMHSDKTLNNALSQVPEGCIVAIEDIDTSLKNREKEPNKTVLIDDIEAFMPLTLGGVLNAIDGLTSSEGRIIIATTNFPDRLDKALVREGRFDLKCSIDYMNNNTLKLYLDRFYKDLDLSGWDIKPNVAPCLVQKLVFDNKNNPLEVLKKVANEHSPKTI